MSILQQAYTADSSRREFLNFLRVRFVDALIEKIEPLHISRKTNFFDEENCYSLGEIQFEDGKAIVLEMRQKSKNDPRITLTRDAFKIIEDLGETNALVIFYSGDSNSWRFSLLTLKKSWGEKEISDPKRYSFLLGVGEKTKTPEKYLSKQVTDFSDLVSRFDVEVVRKEFFNHYLTLYIKLYKAIQADTEFVKLLRSQKVDLVSFTKNLLGKIIFLYFIQKKGWLGVEKGGEFGKDGDKNFMRNFFNNFNDKEKVVWEDTGYFYNDYLEHLFYEGLNKDNRQEDDVSNYFNFRVPYLNGGLFKKDYENWNINKSILSNEVFSNGKDGILDIFDTYNFTIDEDDLYDSDIAVDPEMLGRIFEKMISISSDNIDEIVAIYDKKKKVEIDKELNKKFGAFYTPREIVHYMTKESIIAYLVNNLSGKKEEKEEKIRLLFEYKDKYLTAGDMRQSELSASFEALGDIIEDVDAALSKVKILDPAVGSGAFPMGILHEVSTIRFYIYDVFYRAFNLESQLADYLTDRKVSMYKIKREIIQNNIYGVDIEPGAIDIARLRFWLSLVVDEEQPEPLPNFEFKFVCANTLIPLAEVEEQTQMQLEDTKELNVETLRKYMVEYYNTQKNKEKEDMQGQIKGRIEKFLGIGKNTSMDLFNTKSERTKQLETYHPFEKNHSASFFDPSLMMGNSKFDIVIGNPPYINIEKLSSEFKEKLFKIYSSCKGRTDIYIGFIDLTLSLLKNQGITSFIIPYAFINQKYGTLMRERLIEDYFVKEIIDTSNYMVFDSANVKNIILSVQNMNNKSNTRIKIADTSQSFKTNEFKCHIINQKQFSLLQSSKFETKIFTHLLKIKENIEKKSIKLKDICFVGYGARLNHKTQKIGKSEYIYQEFQEGYKKFTEGSNIERYFFTQYGWLDYQKDIHYNSMFPELFESEKILFINVVKDKLRFSYDADGYYNSHTVINCVKWDLLKNVSHVSVSRNIKKVDIELSSNYNYLFLIGYLNSRLINWYFTSFLSEGLHFYPDDAKNLPIPKISEEKQKPFIEKVDAILEITKESFYDPKNPPKEQLNLEAEIDEMVYELYGLTEEEVRVVEESLG